MTRRVILGNLGAKVERPEERKFNFDPVQRVMADRGRYITAAMTIVRASLTTGEPSKRPTLASYAAWSDSVRSALCGPATAIPWRP
jgi:putative DNA primase/helicase